MSFAWHSKIFLNLSDVSSSTLHAPSVKLKCVLSSMRLDVRNAFNPEDMQQDEQPLPDGPALLSGPAVVCGGVGDHPEFTVSLFPVNTAGGISASS